MYPKNRYNPGLEAPTSRSGGLRGGFEGVLGRLRIFGRLGALLVASWERPRTLLGRLGRVLGTSWDVLEASWGRWGRLGDVFGAS